MKRFAILFLAFLLFSTAHANAADPPASQPAVSREEYEKMRQDQEAMRRELEQLKAERLARPPSPEGGAPAAAPVTQEDLDEIDKTLRDVKRDVHRALPGTEHLIIAGDAAVGFVAQRKTNSTFFAGVSPLFLWEPTDRLLFEAAFDIGINTDPDNNSSTSFDLTIANASYLVNDYLAVGGGLFVVPFGQYHNHFDPPWINKLPDDPLVFSDGGIAPGSEVGIYARGAVPVSTMKFTYDVYLTNGPNLITTDPAAAGSLNFDDFTDLNNGKAVGGRIAALPIPGLEVGYSFQASETAPPKFHNVHAIIQAVDGNWVQDWRDLGGVVTVRGSWIWSDVQRVTYDPTGALGFGPINFGNWRDGGYLELAYRPTYCTHQFVRNLEFVTRYDTLRIPIHAPGGNIEQRWEFGVDYWLTPSAVMKVAYELDDKKVGSGQNAFYVQFGLGL